MASWKVVWEPLQHAQFFPSESGTRNELQPGCVYPAVTASSAAPAGIAAAAGSTVVVWVGGCYRQRGARELEGGYICMWKSQGPVCFYKNRQKSSRSSAESLREP